MSLNLPQIFSKVWEVKWTPSLNQRFQIVQLTSLKGSTDASKRDSKVIFETKDLQKKQGDPIHFRLSLSSKTPITNANGQNQIGMALSFSRIAGAYGSSNWMVFPGPKLVSVQANKSGDFIEDKLLFLAIESEDSKGQKYLTTLELETL